MAMRDDTQLNFASLVPAASESRRYPAGSVILKEGEAGDEMFVLVTGQARISHGNKSLELIGDGGIFGEMALADPGPRSATVTAETDCDVVPIDANRFKFMVHHTPFFALQVMRVMTARLRAMNKSGGLPDED